MYEGRNGTGDASQSPEEQLQSTVAELRCLQGQVTDALFEVTLRRLGGDELFARAAVLGSLRRSPGQRGVAGQNRMFGAGRSLIAPTCGRRSTPSRTMLDRLLCAARSRQRRSRSAAFRACCRARQSATITRSAWGCWTEPNVRGRTYHKVTSKSASVTWPCRWKRRRRSWPCTRDATAPETRFELSLDGSELVPETT
jgi:hypothetical protein